MSYSENSTLAFYNHYKNILDKDVEINKMILLTLCLWDHCVYLFIITLPGPTTGKVIGETF